MAGCLSDGAQAAGGGLSDGAQADGGGVRRLPCLRDKCELPPETIGHWNSKVSLANVTVSTDRRQRSSMSLASSGAAIRERPGADRGVLRLRRGSMPDGAEAILTLSGDPAALAAAWLG